MNTPATVYEALGDEVFDRLVAGFYTRVRTDDILSPMYPEVDLAGAQWRLKAFLVQYWGGPKDYSINRGHPRLRMRHFPFPINRKAALRWLDLMDASLAEIDEETVPPAYRDMLRQHWEKVAAMLINTPD